MSDTPEPIMRFFDDADVNGKAVPFTNSIDAVARVVHKLVPRSAERTVALRKLLEARDAVIRALK